MIRGVTSSPKVKSNDHTLKQLPRTLYNTTHVATTSYSKVSRGLRFPLEVSGLRTRIKCSEVSS